MLADVLLDQALVGSSPNVHLLSYLKHAISTQVSNQRTYLLNELLWFLNLDFGSPSTHLLAYLPLATFLFEWSDLLSS